MLDRPLHTLVALLLATQALLAQQALPSGSGGTLRVLRTEPASVSVAPVTTAITVQFDRPVALNTIDVSSLRVFGRYSGAARGRFDFVLSRGCGRSLR